MKPVSTIIDEIARFVRVGAWPQSVKDEVGSVVTRFGEELIEDLIKEATKERDDSEARFDETDDSDDREALMAWRHTVEWLEEKRGRTDR